MSNIAIRKRRLSTTDLSGLTPPIAEVYIDITKSTLVVGDGTTAGGVPLAKEVHTHANATGSTAGFLSAADKTKLDALSSAGGIQTVESSGSAVTARTIANFNSDFAVTDNSGATRTDFAISSAFRAEVKKKTVALVIALS